MVNQKSVRLAFVLVSFTYANAAGAQQSGRPSAASTQPVFLVSEREVGQGTKVCILSNGQQIRLSSDNVCPYPLKAPPFALGEQGASPTAAPAVAVGPQTPEKKAAETTKDQSTVALPVWPPKSWVTFADYPKTELEAGKTGLTRVAVSVGIDGNVKQCQVVNSSGSIVLDNETCRLTTLRGRFYPAKDKDGRPYEALFFVAVDWRYDQVPVGVSPKGNPANWITSNDYPSKAIKERRGGVVQYRLNVDASGRVIDCNITISSGHPDLDQAACANISRRARFNPATDKMGAAVSGPYSSSHRWVIANDEPIRSANDPNLEKASARCVHLGFKVSSRSYRKCVSEQLVLLANESRPK